MLASEAGRNGTLLEGVVNGVSSRKSEKALLGLPVQAQLPIGSTHAGRKNCSSATYMPRHISSSKKYLPALSSDDCPSSHFFGGGNRKPGGGGPAGVAARAKVVEKRATVVLQPVQEPGGNGGTKMRADARRGWDGWRSTDSKRARRIGAGDVLERETGPALVLCRRSVGRG